MGSRTESHERGEREGRGREEREEGERMKRDAEDRGANREANELVAKMTELCRKKKTRKREQNWVKGRGWVGARERLRVGTECSHRDDSVPIGNEGA